VATRVTRDLGETYTRSLKLISHHPKMPKGPAAALRGQLKADRSRRFREAQSREHGAARASQVALARRTAGAVGAALADPRVRAVREQAGRFGVRAVRTTAGAAGSALGYAARQAAGAAGYAARKTAGAAGSALGYAARKTAGAAGSALGYIARKAASAGGDLGSRALSGAYRGIRAIPTVVQDAAYAARRMANEANVRRLEQQVAAVAARVARGPLAPADT
jgi:hypothetical protein